MMTPETTLYKMYLQILKEELMPAMGCTEPIAIDYAAAKAKQLLADSVKSVKITVSGNIIKNVKSVIVPNTGGIKGISAAAAAGIVAGIPEKVLEVISQVSDEQKDDIRRFMQMTPFQIIPGEGEEQLDIDITLFSENSSVRVRISGSHTNIVLVVKDGVVLHESGKISTLAGPQLTDRSQLRVEHIVEFADQVQIEDVKELLDRQIAYNWAIAEQED